MYLWWSLGVLYLHDMPDESYRRRLRALLLYLCDVFRALIKCCSLCLCGSKSTLNLNALRQSSEAVWKSRWPSWAPRSYHFLTLTPLLSQLVNLPGWKVLTDTSANNMFDGSITNLLSMLCISVEVFSRAQAKRDKSLNHFKFCRFCWSFFEWRCCKHGSERVNVVSVEVRQQWSWTFKDRAQ